MHVPHPLPEALAELIAGRFRVLGDPMRIRVLDLLRDGEATVNDLTVALGTSQQNISKHLRVLLDARIVDRERRGTSAYYSIADDAVFELCEHVCGGLHRQVEELAAILGTEEAA